MKKIVSLVITLVCFSSVTHCFIGSTVKKATEKVVKLPTKTFNKMDGAMDRAYDRLDRFCDKHPIKGDMLKGFLLACALNPTNPLLIIAMIPLVPLAAAPVIYDKASDLLSESLRDRMAEDIAWKEKWLAQSEDWAKDTDYLSEEAKLRLIAMNREELAQLKEKKHERDREQLVNRLHNAWK